MHQRSSLVSPSPTSHPSFGVPLVPNERLKLVDYKCNQRFRCQCCRFGDMSISSHFDFIILFICILSLYVVNLDVENCSQIHPLYF